MRDGDPVRAEQVLREALDLWRGPAFADFPDAGFVAAQVRRWEMLRETAHQDLYEAGLALGRHAELVGELTAYTIGIPWPNADGRCSPSPSTGVVCRRTRWPRSAAPQACWPTSSGWTSARRCGAWRPRSCARIRRWSRARRRRPRTATFPTR